MDASGKLTDAHDVPESLQQSAEDLDPPFDVLLAAALAEGVAPDEIAKTILIRAVHDLA